MVKPEKKLKKVLLILGITGAVYGGFRYLLPLVIPFLLAYATAVWLRPSVRFLERRLKWNLRGKEFCVPGWLIGAAELLLLFAGIIFLFYLGGRMFFAQIRSFISQVPLWANRLEEWVTAACLRLEAAFGFSAGFLSDRVGSVAEELMEAARTATMPALMDQSVQAVGKLAGGLVFFFIYFIAVILCLQEMEELRERKSRSVFHRELSLLGRRLVAVGNAWLRTQLLLFFLVSLICMAGLLLLGNSYFLLLGPVIGLVDALPVFGAGTVLIPWSLLSFLQGRWGQGSGFAFPLSGVLSAPAGCGGQADGRAGGADRAGNLVFHVCGAAAVWNHRFPSRPHRFFDDRGSSADLRRAFWKSAPPFVNLRRE